MEPSTNLDYAAVRHVLTAPQIAPRTAEYVSADGFDFTGLGREAETMSGGEQLLVAIAHELWHAEKKTGLWDLVRRLDAANFERVLEALRIARGAYASGSAAAFLAAHKRLAA
jgi:energy-coupling factor transporter ATP-binding protein EcfA2